MPGTIAAFFSEPSDSGDVPRFRTSVDLMADQIAAPVSEARFALRYAVAMPKSPSARRRRAIVAAMVLATALAGCVHLPAVVVPRAVAGVPGIVVFDVDGTLTPAVARIFSVRPDAAAVARIYAGRGYRIVYLTARAPALQGTLRAFLSRHDFPPGDLLVPKNWAEHAAPAAFKAHVLAEYLAQGWDIGVAYGDSSSDFEAYARAGIPRERVLALRRVGAARCQPGAWAACLPGWEQQRQALSTAPR